jgi:hypothetical protein
MLRLVIVRVLSSRRARPLSTQKYQIIKSRLTWKLIVYLVLLNSKFGNNLVSSQRLNFRKLVIIQAIGIPWRRLVKLHFLARQINVKIAIPPNQ